ncbi:hypothetical protein [Blastopirellula marina]|uniref:Leucine Rich repeats (2 copies) n=1 Tax=Blastopirellula marina TaxID=124 RepID=A0A2S8GPJ0_9BACT|nr:hypothetical protein [Blastopirellula marina]PQO46271.1 hypothetical protein C5Y93_09805 [Blastopirellula marina]
MNDHAAYQPPTDRRWLRTVLLGGAFLILLIGFPLIWLGSEFYAAQQRLAAIRLIEEQGGEIYRPYDAPDEADLSLAQRLAMAAMGEEINSNVMSVMWTGENIGSVLPALSYVRELQTLEIHDTTLSEAETAAIAKLPLEVILLSDVQLSPDQLQQLATNESLTNIVLEGPAASHEHLKRLPALGTLRWVGLSDTRLSDDSLQPLTKIMFLSALNISRVELESEEALAPLRQLKDLKILNLVDLPIDDSLFDKIAPLKHLEQLTLDKSKKSPELVDPQKAMETIGSLSNLKYLRLMNLPVSNEALQSISRATQLEELMCDGSQITDAGVQHLLKLKKLNHLRIHGAQLTDESIRELAKLPVLQSIELHDGSLRVRSNNFGVSPTAPGGGP